MSQAVPSVRPIAAAVAAAAAARQANHHNFPGESGGLSAAFAALGPRSNGLIDVTPTAFASPPAPTATFSRDTEAYVWDGFYERFRAVPVDTPRFHGAFIEQNLLGDSDRFAGGSGTATGPFTDEDGDTYWTWEFDSPGTGGETLAISHATTFNTFLGDIEGRSFICIASVRAGQASDEGKYITLRGKRASGGTVSSGTTEIMLTDQWQRIATGYWTGNASNAGVQLRLLSDTSAYNDGVGAAKVDIKQWQILEVTALGPGDNNNDWGDPDDDVGEPPLEVDTSRRVNATLPICGYVPAGTWRSAWKGPSASIDLDDDSNFDSSNSPGPSMRGHVIARTQETLHPILTEDGQHRCACYPFAARNTAYSVGDRVIPDGLRPYGSGELVSDDTASGFAALNSATVADSGGRVRITNTEGGVGGATTLTAQTITTVVGHQYRLRFDGYVGTSGQFTVQVTNSTGTSHVEDLDGVDVNYTRTGDQSFDLVFVANDTSTVFTFSNGDGTLGEYTEFDNLSIEQVKDQTSVYLECTGAGTSDSDSADTINALWPFDRQAHSDLIGQTLTDGGVTWRVQGRYTRQGFIGLTCEGQSTNEVNAEGRDFTNGGWGNGGTTAVVAAAFGIDGRSEKISLEDDDSGAQEQKAEFATGSDNFFSASAFIKKDAQADDYPRLYFQAYDGATAVTRACFVNKNTGAVDEEIGANFHFIEDWGEWWRVVLFLEAGSNPNIQFRIYPAASTDFSSTSNAALGTTVFDFVQIESDVSFATSPMWSRGSTTTRNADDLQYAVEWEDGLVEDKLFAKCMVATLGGSSDFPKILNHGSSTPIINANFPLDSRDGRFQTTDGTNAANSIVNSSPGGSIESGQHAARKMISYMGNIADSLHLSCLGEHGHNTPFDDAWGTAHPDELTIGANQSQSNHYEGVIGAVVFLDDITELSDTGEINVYLDGLSGYDG